MKYLKYPIFIITGILYFSFLGSIDLWDPDEPRYVEIAREMISLKEYIIPHLNSQIYAHKPPLFFWTIAIFFKIFHSYSEWIARLVPSISGFLIVLLTYFYAKKIFRDEKIGIFSALVLSTSATMMHLSRRCNIDTFFTLFILIAIIFLHTYVLKNKKVFLYISMFFQGVATLIKGPLGFIIPFLTYTGYLIFTNDKKRLKNTPYFISFLILLFVVSLWLIPSYFLGGEGYIKQLILKHVFQRYAEGVNHPRSFFYYFYIFPLDFLPWSVFLYAVFRYCVFNTKEKLNKNLIWFLCYFFINFIFLCFSKEKRGLYLLPLYPAMAIIYGYAFAKIEYYRLKSFEYPFIFISGIIGILSLGSVIFYFTKTGKINPILTVLTAISFWWSFFTIQNYKKIKTKFKVFTIYFCTSIILFSIYSFIFPLYNNLKSPKIFVEKLSMETKNFDDVLFFRYINPGFNFYLKKDKLNFTKNFNVLKALVNSKKAKFVVIKKKEYRKEKKEFDKIFKNYKLDFIHKLGHRNLMVFKLVK